MIIKNKITNNYIIVEEKEDWVSEMLYYKYGVNLKKSKKDIVKTLKDKIVIYYSTKNNF